MNVEAAARLRSGRAIIDRYNYSLRASGRRKILSAHVVVISAVALMTRSAGKSESTYWVVVADQSMAEFYFREKKNSPLQRLFTMKNDAGQKKLIDLTSDRDGRSFDSHGQGRHSLTKEKTDAKKHESQIFANQISDRIVGANQRGEFSELALIAAPRFLGTLRKSLSVVHGIPIYLSINKDVVGQDTTVIEKLLAEHMLEKR